MQSQLGYLGLVIDAHGTHPTKENTPAICDAPTQRNVTELLSCLVILYDCGKFLIIQPN